MSKYDPLHAYLRQLPTAAQEHSLTFAQVENILGFRLPRSAYVYREWWANPSKPSQHPYAQSWLAAGWQVGTVNQPEQWVCFKRLNTS